MAILRDNTGLESIVVFFRADLIDSPRSAPRRFSRSPLWPAYPRTAVRLGSHTRGSEFPVDVHTRIRNTVVHFLPGIVKSGFVVQNICFHVCGHIK